MSWPHEPRPYERLRHGSSPDDAFPRLLHGLEAAGLWREVPPHLTREILRCLRSGQEVTWHRGGAWNADGEDLAEGEVEDWLRGMAEPLRACGVALEVATASSPYDDGSPGYTVTVNGTSLPLYRFDPADPRLPLTRDPWLDCTVVPAAAVNRLLRAAGSDRRLGLFRPGGNDGFCVLGPAEVLRAAASALPPAAEPPAFVMPAPPGPSR